MTVTLADYLKGASGRPFVWGECDCCLFAADWIKQKKGLDVAWPHRGTYSDNMGAARLLCTSDNGTLSGFLQPRMMAAGFVLTDDPREGDVAVLRLPIHGETVGIRTRLKRWAFKTERGVFTAACPNVVVAWRIA